MKKLFILGCILFLANVCYSASFMSKSAVTSIVAGTNVTVSPPDGRGDVTVSASTGNPYGGDSFGSHIATQTVNMAGHNIINSPDFIAVGVSTQTLRTDLTATSLSTGTINADLQTSKIDIGNSTTTLRTDLTAVKNSTGVAQIVAGTNISISPTDGKGNVTINSTGGGLPTTTTVYINISSGGDVFVASSVFVSIPGAYRTFPDTYTIIEYQAYNLVASTVSATNYQLAYTTCTDETLVWSNITPEITVSSYTKYSAWVSTNIVVNFQDSLALHITTCPYSGTLPGEYGIRFKAWRKW